MACGIPYAVDTFFIGLHKL